MNLNTSMVKASNTQLITAFNRDQIDLIKRTMAKGATDDELKLFLYQAQKKGLDPLSKQIYFQKRRNKKGEDQLTIITGIDGYRTLAVRTGQYAGNDDPVFDNEDRPTKATVTVYRLVGGVRCAFSATARWDQYYPGDAIGFMWNKMPHLMLGKCAEALALRKAFPEELSGLYVKEEMDQAGPPMVLDAVAEPTRAPETDPAADHNWRPAKPSRPGYDPEDPAKVAWLEKALDTHNIPKARHVAIAERMVGRPSADLLRVVDELAIESGEI